MYEIEELLKNNVISIVNNGNGKKLSWTWGALEKWVVIPSSRGKIGQFDTIEEAIKELLKED